MPLPNTPGVYIYNGYNCTPTLLPTAASIPVSPQDSTTVAEKLNCIPTPPTTDGQYVLSVTISGGVPTYEWIVPSGGGGLQTSQFGLPLNTGADISLHTAQYTSKPLEEN